MKLDNTKKALKSVAHEGKETVVHFGKFVKAMTFDTPKGIVTDVRIDTDLLRKAKALVKAGVVTTETPEPQQ